MTEEYDLIIRNARIFGRPNERLFDIATKEGRIASIQEHVASKGAEEIEAKGRLATPAFYNMHFHLDSVLKMGDPRYNKSGTLWEGIQIWAELKDSLTEREILARSEKAVKWMAAFGTLWLRTHADCTSPSLNTVKALVRGKTEFSDLIDLQVTSFPQDGIRTEPGNLELLEKSLELGADNVGMIPHNEWTREDGVKSIEDAFSLASKYDKDVDGHVDETDDPSSRYLEVVAAQTVRRNRKGRVTAGHVTASHSWDPSYRYRIANLVSKAGITIIANPLINLHLQGRFDGYPKRRGMAPIKFFLESGVNVCLGHDCIMDPWYPLGVGDMLQTLFMAVHVDQMMGYEELCRSIELITFNAAKAWRVEGDYGLETGRRANLLLANASSAIDLVRILGPPLYVVRDGKIIAKNLSRWNSEVLHKGRWEKLEFF
jgi:cytosine deaminase